MIDDADGWFDVLGEIRNPTEIRQWQALGQNETEARSFRALGLKPEAAAPWIELGMPADDVAAWRASGFNSSEEVAGWIEIGVDCTEARVFSNLEIDPSAALNWIESIGHIGLTADLLLRAVRSVGKINVVRIIRVAHTSGVIPVALLEAICTDNDLRARIDALQLDELTAMISNEARTTAVQPRRASRIADTALPSA